VRNGKGRPEDVPRDRGGPAIEAPVRTFARRRSSAAEAALWEQRTPALARRRYPRRLRAGHRVASGSALSAEASGASPSAWTPCRPPR